MAERVENGYVKVSMGASRHELKHLVIMAQWNPKTNPLMNVTI
jgi:hypothetical protein